MSQFYELFILLEKISCTYLLVSMFSIDVKTQTEPLFFSLINSLKNYTNQLTSQVSTYIVENKESRAKLVLPNLSGKIEISAKIQIQEAKCYFIFMK